jgi:hypothetical protein
MTADRKASAAVDHHDHHREDPCRTHVRRYLRAPFIADEARRTHSDRPAACHTADVITPGVPPSLQQVLQEWAVAESTPDEDIAAFIGWPIEQVREHR